MITNARFRSIKTVYDALMGHDKKMSSVTPAFSDLRGAKRQFICYGPTGRHIRSKRDGYGCGTAIFFHMSTGKESAADYQRVKLISCG